MYLELPVLSLIEVLISELKTSLSSLFFQRLVLSLPVLSLSKCRSTCAELVEVSGLCSLTGQ